jgi:DNA (cytosine-5-)-methyltransferase
MSHEKEHSASIKIVLRKEQKIMLKHLSLFAGCGGIDLGFQWAGFETVAGVEIKKFACDTLRLNHPNMKIFGPPEFDGDIRKFNASVLKEMIGDVEIDVISGGPPCQPFSIASAQRFYKDDERYKRKGNEDSEKGNLLPEYIRIINEIRPKAFVIENVAALISWNDGTFLTESLKALDSDYVYSIPNAIHAENFGIPQCRERMIIIGTRIPNKYPIFDDNSIKIDRLFTVDDALSDFPKNPLNHQLRAHTPETIARYDKLKYGERDKKGRVDRLNPNLPAKTVIAGGENGGGRSHLHPYLPRTTSPRECARFQTFPDDFELCGTMSRQFTQVGNAVPPLLSYFIATYIKKYIFDLDIDIETDLSDIKHPVVKRIPEHLISFKTDGQKKDDNRQMTLDDFFGDNV